MSFGVLTLATMGDHQKAVGLALSLRVSNPDVPIAVACSSTVRPIVAPYFDFCVEEEPTLRGFIHKLHLDRYSPFEETFFFDSDVLVFRPLKEVLGSWRIQPYSACGKFVTTGISTFGLDTERTLKIIDRSALVDIGGAGHAYFRKPECEAIFELAREVAANYEHYAGQIKFADEDVMNIVMTMLDMKPMPHFDFWSRPLSAKRGSMKIDASEARCTLELVETGQIQRPVMMHFAAKEAAFLYARQRRRLLKRFDVPTEGLMLSALHDFYLRDLKSPLKARVDRLKHWMSGPGLGSKKRHVPSD
jgi:hypothetical protein